MAILETTLDTVSTDFSTMDVEVLSGCWGHPGMPSRKGTCNSRSASMDGRGKGAVLMPKGPQGSASHGGGLLKNESLHGT